MGNLWFVLMEETHSKLHCTVTSIFTLRSRHEPDRAGEDSGHL